MNLEEIVLTGRRIRLEPLGRHHIEALSAAGSSDSSLYDDSIYQWTVVPQNIEEAAAYVQTALDWRDAGTAIPFAIVRIEDNKVIGSTRYFDIAHWDWPTGHERHGNAYPDASEMGYTWYARSTIRSGANTEGKFLMLQHAFEDWKALRVSLHTDVRNVRSQASMERIGFKREGVIRVHKLAADGIPRDSVRYSMIAAEWPESKQRLMKRLDR